MFDRSEQPISEIMTTNVVTVRPEDRLMDVEQLMIQRGLSSVPVVNDHDMVFGIISLRDIARQRQSGMKEMLQQAWEACTFSTIQVQAETSVFEVARLMVEQQIHHVVVTDGDRLIGIVSALDFVEEFLLGRR